MKKVFLNVTRIAVVASFGIATLVACNNNKPKDSEEVAEEQNDQRFEEKKSEKDAQFLVDAAVISMEEIELGKLALAKSMDADVKGLAKMMVDEHEKALTDEKGLASSKSVTLPASMPDDVQKAYDDLNQKKGWDFDEAYSDKMVKGHEDAIKKFEKYAEDADDADVRNWASNMLPNLRNHLDHAKMVHDKVKAMKKK